MNKITFTDKVDTQINPDPEINKVTASTLNEIKTIVNETVDQVEVNLSDIGQTVKITGDQTISGSKTFTGVARTAFVNSDSQQIRLSHTGGSELGIGASSSSSTINSSDGITFKVNYPTSPITALTLSDAGLATFSAGVSVTGNLTASSFLGDLNGTINTLTTAITKANATNDTTVATTAFVRNLIGEIPAGLSFEGTWDADTNTPDLSTETLSNGKFWIVSVSGATDLGGITDWKVGDWAIYVTDGAGTDGWQKVDNSSVLDGQGTGQTVALWSGSGDTNTLTNAPITVSGDDVTFAGTTTVQGTGDSSFVGNVGIGTDNPTAKLELYTDAGNSSMRFSGGAANNETYDIRQGVAGISNGGLSFTNVTTGTETMVFQDVTGNVGIGTDNPGALLDVSSTVNGVLLPRMTTTQVNAISSPSNGLTVYNITLNTLCFYNGSSWQKVNHATM